MSAAKEVLEAIALECRDAAIDAQATAMACLERAVRLETLCRIATEEQMRDAVLLMYEAGLVNEDAVKALATAPGGES